MSDKQTDKQRVTGVEPNSFAGRRRSSTHTGSHRDLHICPACASRLVYPVDWEPAQTGRWSVQLRCPDCEWLGGGIYEQKVVDRFDEELDRGTEEVLDDLSVLTRANMEDQIERFVAALDRDQILPEDF